MEYAFKLVSSLEKVFFDKPDSMTGYTYGSMLKNEIYSFQLAGLGYDEEEQRLGLRMEVESELKPYINVYQVGYVPSLLSMIDIGADDDYITKVPGLFPDPLHKGLFSLLF